MAFLLAKNNRDKGGISKDNGGGNITMARNETLGELRVMRILI